MVGRGQPVELRDVNHAPHRLPKIESPPGTGRAALANRMSIMSNLRVFDPFFSDDFDSALRRFFAPAKLEANSEPLKMRVDVSEGDGAYAVKADIPGVKKEDIAVRIDGNVVQIDAEARRDKEEKGNGDKVLRSERYYGMVSRTFSLADDIDEAKVEAKYADGVLTLKLPKKAAVDTRRKIAIQ